MEVVLTMRITGKMSVDSPGVCDPYLESTMVRAIYVEMRWNQGMDDIYRERWAYFWDAICTVRLWAV